MNRLFIVIMTMFTSFVAFGQEATTVAPDVNGWLAGLVPTFLGAVPYDIIGWTLAVFALLNGLSMGLAKIAAMTTNTTDDMIQGKLAKLLAFCQKVIDFVTANQRPS